MAFSRTGKSWKKATGPGKFWKSVNSAKNMKCMGSSKEINIEILGLSGLK